MPGRSKAREQEQAKEKKQLRTWRAWRRERVEGLLTGPHAAPAKALLEYLKTMNRPSALVDFVKSSPLLGADAGTRFEILALVDAAIVRRRTRMGWEPFDDALPDQPANVFLLVREQLFPSNDGAARGAARFNQTTKNAKSTTEIYHDRVNAD